jgi:hypothetical protein
MHTPTNNLFDLPPPINPLLTRGTAQVSHRNRDPIINPAHRTTVPTFASASAASVPTIVRPRSTSRGRSSSRGRAVSRGRGRSSRSSSRGSSRGRGRAVSRGNTRRARSRSINNRVSSHTLKIPSPEIQ